MSGFTFDAAFQRGVLKLCMEDDAFCSRAVQFVQPEYFSSAPLGWIFKAIKSYWDAYSMRCTALPLRQALYQLSPDKRELFAAEVEQVLARSVVEGDYIKKELKDFIQRSIFAVAHEESARLFNAGKMPEAYDVSARAQDRIQQVGFDKIDRQWFFEELSDRQHARLRAQLDLSRTPFTTFWELDKLTEGGVHPGEVWAVLAYAKRCKTTWLINQGFNATRINRRPVLHFVLEGTGDQISARYDALFSGELYSVVKHGNMDTTLYRQFQQETEYLRSLLVIRTVNDWDVTILNIAAEITELRAHGFKPDMLILDYVDLLRSRSRVDSETQHQVNATRDLKRLVNNMQLACWTAWQAQRPKEDAHTTEHILTSSQVADSYAKVRIVDCYGSLNATDAEMARGDMRIHIEGHRDHAVGKTWKVTNDLSRMRMAMSAHEYTPPSGKKEVKNEFGEKPS